MDEPTSVLTPQEVARLFETLKRLSAEGLSILYISHKLDEIKALCHRATILRNGKRVDEVSVSDESTGSLAAKMMGEALETVEARTAGNIGDVRLAVNNLSLPAADEFGIPLKQISLDVRCGEIVGIAGVAGNGQDELLMALSGESMSSQPDSLKIDSKECGHLGPNGRRELGVAAIPEQRLGHGAVPEMNLVDNTFLTAFQRLGLIGKGFIKGGVTRKFTEQIISDFNVKSNGSKAFASSLSGGNLQKFIVGREILQKPGLLIVSQPTWGVDAGAAQTIHKALRELADNGAAVLIISQDLDELMGSTDRIGAICAGALSPLYPTRDVTIEEVGLLMAGTQLEKHPTQTSAANADKEPANAI
jgi:simple sugar transport system ATP-binding protein